jgi:hypothetical protein
MMLSFTRLSIIFAAVGGVLAFLLAGFQPVGLPFQPEAIFSDAVVSHFGAAYHLRDSIYEGSYPLRNDIILGGQPFAANPLSKTAYPLQWLVLITAPFSDLTPSIPIQHLNNMLVLHLALAALGMWRWARSVGIRPEGAALSAIVYVLAPRMVGHLGAGHLDIVYAMAWFPWLMERLHLKPWERYTGDSCILVGSGRGDAGASGCSCRIVRRDAQCCVCTAADCHQSKTA